MGPRRLDVSVWLKQGIINRHAVIAPVFVDLIAFSVRLLLLLVIPPPQLSIRDEFSYLLAAHTFSRGRLANPI